MFDQIFVSSDSQEILNYSLSQNVSVVKGQKILKRFSSANDVVKHFIKQSRILNGEDS